MAELLPILEWAQKTSGDWGGAIALLTVLAWLIRSRWVEHTTSVAQARKSDADAESVRADAYQKGMAASGAFITKLLERNDSLTGRIEELERRLDELEEESGQNMAKLRAQVAELQSENTQLREALDRETEDKVRLLRENADLRGRVGELERVVRALQEQRICGGER